jgi:hypothetical protein
MYRCSIDSASLASSAAVRLRRMECSMLGCSTNARRWIGCRGTSEPLVGIPRDCEVLQLAYAEFDQVEILPESRFGVALPEAEVLRCNSLQVEPAISLRSVERLQNIVSSVELFSGASDC